MESHELHSFILHDRVEGFQRLRIACVSLTLSCDTTLGNTWDSIFAGCLLNAKIEHSHCAQVTHGVVMQQLQQLHRRVGNNRRESVLTKCYKRLTAIIVLLRGHRRKT